MSSYVQEAIQNSGINRTELTAACAYLIRSKQATGQHDAIEKLASGEINGADLLEQMTRSFQVEIEEEEIIEVDTAEDELRTLMSNSTES
jgi:fructosamine-3-kinase